MSSYEEFIIHSQNLHSSNQIQCDIILKKSCESTLYGTVLSCNCQPLVNAAVSVYEINYNCKPAKVNILGFVTTNNNGEFAVSVKVAKGIYYEFSVFNPLKK